MAKTPRTTAASRKQSRPTRTAAPVRFNLDGSDEEEMDKKNISGEPLRDSSTILKEHRDHQAKKASTRVTEYQTQKKAIYAAARKSAQDLSKSGIAYLESSIAKIQEMKSQESSQEKTFGDYEQLLRVQEAAAASLLSMYPPLVNELASQRSEEVNSASEMHRRNPSCRHVALHNFSKNARAHVEEARQNEQAATDASALLKHYKNLLYA